MDDLNDQKVIDELVDTACLAIDEHIMANLALLNKPECHTLLNDMVFDDLRVQFENIYDEKIEEIIQKLDDLDHKIETMELNVQLRLPDTSSEEEDDDDGPPETGE